jgi:hypothetical protein
MNRKIKNILIEPGLQLRLLSYFVALFALTIITLYLVNYYFFATLKGKALAVGIPLEHVFFSYLNDQKSALDRLFFFLAFLNFIFLSAVGFIVSHRVAGPFYKLKRHLRELGPNSPDLKLRNRDLLKDIEPIVNDLRDRLK